MAELTTAEKLVEARTALHKLLTGAKMVQVGYGDTRVQYTQASIDELRRYIGELLAESDPDTYRRSPFGVAW